MTILDTQVLVYAMGVEHPLRGTCATLIDAIGDRRLPATTTAEVIQEFAHVRARRYGRSDAVLLARHYARMLCPLLTVSLEDLDDGLAVYRETPRLGAFDSILAAIGRRARGATLVTADRGFGDVEGLSVVFPDQTGIAALLATTAAS